MVGGTNKVTGKHEVIEQPVCEEHFAELTRRCDWKGCNLLACNVVPITGTSATTGAYKEDELGMCDKHYEEFAEGSDGDPRRHHDDSRRPRQIPPSANNPPSGLSATRRVF